MNAQINFEELFEYLDVRARHYLSGTVGLNFDEIVVYPYTTTLRSGEPEANGWMAQTYKEGNYTEDKIFFMTLENAQKFAEMLNVKLTKDEDLDD